MSRICRSCKNWNHWHDTPDLRCEDPRCECTYKPRNGKPEHEVRVWADSDWVFISKLWRPSLNLDRLQLERHEAYKLLRELREALVASR